LTEAEREGQAGKDVPVLQPVLSGLLSENAEVGVDVSPAQQRCSGCIENLKGVSFFPEAANYIHGTYGDWEKELLHVADLLGIEAKVFRK